ncbi:membrane protein (plasmid) [Candidatus Borrelia fainii]|uniref:Membrane protein n=1 Tax=Candidatus Borrelia fainii TaxID=2518322 RepID=A0ABM8DL49_9SPIR|nr:P13 family porin [Candidatus Borrelia fainii]BDU62463.1 membrane protein [Candidatus Borrelia fainii]BDU63310.1 membrane protein [Candidatus Borrelia fainii]BDU63315.1 membrane protein [Candidatus Borrelia fainii]
MKQVLILMLFFVCIVVSFAQSYDEMASDAVTAKGNMDSKLLFYEIHKQNTLVPFLLNFFVGFGIGSFVQGDLTGGLLILGFDMLGFGLISGGMYSLSQYKGINTPTIALSLMSLGGITLFVTRIVEIIIPFTYASSYNRKLREKLGISLGGFKPQFEINFNENSGLVFELAFTKKY